jgi:hypothetical protein
MARFFLFRGSLHIVASLGFGISHNEREINLGPSAEVVIS